MRRRIASILLLIAAGLLIGFQSGSAKRYSADRFDVEVIVRPDGSARVTETITFNFEGGPFTYAFREIPFRRADGISEFTLTEEGRHYPFGIGEGQLEIQLRRNDWRLQWRFPPTWDQRRAFTLAYTVRGLVRQAVEGDAVIWRAVPEDHEYPIAASRVTVVLPESVPRVLGTRTWGTNAQVNVDGRQVTFTARDIRPDRMLEVGVWVPAGAIIAAPPEWQAREAERERFTIPLLLASAALFLAGLATLLSFWYRRGRGPVPVRPTGSLYQPPSDLAPGLAGALVRGRAEWPDLLATLVDLARRGFLSIEEVAEERRVLGLSLGRSRDYALILEPRDDFQHSFEAKLFNLLAAQAKGTPPTAWLSDLSTAFRKEMDRLTQAIEEQLVAEGLFSPEGRRLGYAFRNVGLVLIAVSVVAMGLAILLLSRLGPGVFGFFGAFMALGFAALILFALTTQRTGGGAHAAGLWSAFRAYLKNFARLSERPGAVDVFEPFLAYATAFGLAEQWVRHFAREGAPLPAWYHALAGDLASADVGAISAWFAASSASAGATGGAAGATGGGAGGGASGAG